MNKKRNRLEIIKDILEVLQRNKQVKITHLIYKANLSNNSIKPYLEDLLKNGIIEQIDDSGQKLFRLGEKGREFLNEYDKIKIFSDSYGL